MKRDNENNLWENGAIKLYYDNYEEVYKKLWDKQHPSFETSITREEFDIRITQLREYILSYMKETGTLGLQLFKNVYILHDATLSDICSSRKGSFSAIHFEDTISYKHDNNLWLPSMDSYSIKRFMIEPQDQVIPMYKEQLNNKEVSYRCIDCDNSKWKYITYHDIFGLTYSNDEVPCIANSSNIEKVDLVKVTPGQIEDMFKDDSILMINDVRESVENLDMDYIYSWVDSLTKLDKSKEASIMFNISGYDKDTRELWEIPEVRDYVHKLLNEKPEFLWFLDDMTFFILTYTAIISTQIGGGEARIAIDGDKATELSRIVLKALKSNSFFTKDDIKTYMKKFNNIFGREIYYL